VHGELIQADKEAWWCVNAGVMRLDPDATRNARKKNVAAMVREIRQIKCPTALPEQYYLAKRIGGWRHLDNIWNMEVGAQYEDPGYTWPREGARRDSSAKLRGRLWMNQEASQVHVFHFSGTKLHPWWYCDLSPEETYEEAAREWQHRDPRRLIATALCNWRQALEEVVHEVAKWPAYERDATHVVVKRLRQRASDYRRWWLSERAKGIACKRCQQRVMKTEGRWLMGWEGWWLCHDCVVGYVMSDEEPEAPICGKCKGSNADNGRWKWSKVNRHWTPVWQCDAC